MPDLQIGSDKIEAKMDLVSKVLDGDVLAAARLMRGLDDSLAEAVEALDEIYLHTGRAHVIGVTGAPGVGKSTLLGTLISVFRGKNMTVGVVAIDPTSPLTNGAILGDRIRMQGNGVDKGVFIRSLATRGWKGGLSEATTNTVHVMDAMGKDVIFVEAVGSGQAEVDIAKVADTSILILNPGMGDAIQMMKAGILEIADIFAINKADREGADSLKAGLEAMLDMKAYTSGDWKPSIVLTEAVFNKGAKLLAEEIMEHRKFLVSGGGLEKCRRERAKLELMMAIEISVRNYIDKMDKDSMEKLVDELVDRKISPQSIVSKIINVPREG